MNETVVLELVNKTNQQSKPEKTACNEKKKNKIEKGFKVSAKRSELCDFSPHNDRYSQFLMTIQIAPFFTLPQQKVTEKSLSSGMG